MNMPRGSNWYRSIGGIGTIFGIGIADTLSPDTSIPAFWSILSPKIDQFGRFLGPTYTHFYHARLNEHIKYDMNMAF